MNIRELSQYAQFANLAYVKWKNVAATKIEDELIKAAYEAEHISGNITTPSDTLGELIFKGWQILNHYPNDETGLSATLFGNGTEKILSIRGTEPGMPDLYEVDLQDIGYYGVAIEQLVELYNYISLLSVEEGQEGIPQIEYHVSINEPVGQDYLRDPNIVSGFGQYHWFEVNYLGVGIGGLGWDEQISITGPSFRFLIMEQKTHIL